MVRSYPHDEKSITTVRHAFLSVFPVRFKGPGRLSPPPSGTKLPIFASPDSATTSWGPLLLDTQVKSLLHSHPKKEVLSTTPEASSKHLSRVKGFYGAFILKRVVCLDSRQEDTR